MTTLVARWERPSRTGTAGRYVLLVVGAVVMVLPFLYMLSTSFKGQQYVLTTPPQWIPHPATASNYSGVLGADNFALYFLNSVIVSVASTVISLLLSSMMAYAFARFSFPCIHLLTV